MINADTSKEAVELVARTIADGNLFSDTECVAAAAMMRALLAERDAVVVARDSIGNMWAAAVAEIARLTAALAQSSAETQAALEAETEYRRKNHQLTNERDAALAGCVKVNPLVWFEVEKYRHGGKYTAEGYTIRYIEGLFILDFAGNSKSVWRFPTLETAKAAAQADYEARILAAIQPDTSKLAMVRAAFGNLVNHDVFQDEEYLSEDLIAKLNAARAALALITAQDGK